MRSVVNTVLASLLIISGTGCTDENASGSQEKRDGQLMQDNSKNIEKGPDGQPIIFWRIKQENRKAVSAMLDTGYDIEIKGGFDATPIIGAALIDDWITVLLLLERGANPLAVDRRGFTMTYMLSTSRIDRKGSHGAALENVETYLRKKGINSTPYEPMEVKKMLADSNWPPKK